MANKNPSIAELTQKRKDLEAQKSAAELHEKSLREQLAQARKEEIRAIRSEEERVYKSKVDEMKDEFEFASGDSEWIGIERDHNGNFEVSMYDGTSFISSVKLDRKDSRELFAYLSTH